MNPEQLIGAHSRPRMTSQGPLIMSHFVMSHFDRFAGIGISKNRRDICCHPDGWRSASPTHPMASAGGAKAGGGVAFGCEAAGGYEDLLLVTLPQAGAPGHCLHPAGILAFARLKGKRAKTGARDAKAIGPSPRRRLLS
jgi:hypothetical protein